MADGTWNLLLLVVVSPNVRGAGRGAAGPLFGSRASGRGGEVVLIETSCVEAFAAPRRFYLRRGCRQEASIQDFYADGDGKGIV